MSTNHTKNYNLCQWEAEDQVLRTDFNEDNAKIDAALAAVAAKVPGVNLSCYTTSYSGYGSSSASSRKFTFPGRPMMIMIQGSNRMYFAFRGLNVLYCPNFSTSSYGSVSWGDNSATLSGGSGDYGANHAETSYRLFALLEV